MAKKSANPVDQARREQKKKDKAKNAKARKAAREAPKKTEGASTSAGPVIIPGQRGGAPVGGRGKDGRDPRRSIYYDPVFNPYGAPPPGMEYRERDPSPEAVSEDSSDSSDEESDGIELPEGPKPESESDEDVPMPEGPPPSQPAPLLARPSIAQSGPSGPPMMPQGFPVPQGGLLPFPPQPPMMIPGPPQFQPRMALPHFDPLTGAPQQPFQAYRNGPPMQAPAPRPPPSKPSQEDRKSVV